MMSSWAVGWSGAVPDGVWSVSSKGDVAIARVCDVAWLLLELHERVECVAVVPFLQSHCSYNGVTYSLPPTPNTLSPVVWKVEAGPRPGTLRVSVTPLLSCPPLLVASSGVLSLHSGHSTLLPSSVLWGGWAVQPGMTLCWGARAIHSCIVWRGGGRTVAGVRFGLALPHRHLFVALQHERDEEFHFETGKVLSINREGVLGSVDVPGHVQSLRLVGNARVACVSGKGKTVAVVEVLHTGELAMEEEAGLIEHEEEALLPCCDPWVRVPLHGHEGSVLCWKGSVLWIEAGRLEFRPLPPHMQPSPPRTLAAAHEVHYSTHGNVPCDCLPSTLLVSRLRAARRLEADPHWTRMFPTVPWEACMALSPACAALCLPLVPPPALVEGQALFEAQLALGRFAEAGATLRFALGGHGKWSKSFPGGAAGLLWGGREAGALNCALDGEVTMPLWAAVADLCEGLALVPHVTENADALTMSMDKRTGSLLRQGLHAAGDGPWALPLAVVLLDRHAAAHALRIASAEVRHEWSKAVAPWSLFCALVEKV